MNFKTLSILFIAVLFSGCYNSQETLPLPKEYQLKKISTATSVKTKEYNTQTTFQKPSPSISSKRLVKKSVEFRGDGYIKGIVKTIRYNRVKKRWIYTIQGTDTTNGKLDFAKAYASKKLAKRGDLVYAIIKNGYINSIYIYKSLQIYTNYKKKRLIKKSKHAYKKLIKQKKISKTKHRKQLLPPPKVQTITF